jgi:uncharacterized BrkB/YihY/UPF0761 family membrane protein
MLLLATISLLMVFLLAFILNVIAKKAANLVPIEKEYKAARTFYTVAAVILNGAAIFIFLPCIFWFIREQRSDISIFVAKVITTLLGIICLSCGTILAFQIKKYFKDLETYKLFRQELDELSST